MICPTKPLHGNSSCRSSAPCPCRRSRSCSQRNHARACTPLASLARVNTVRSASTGTSNRASRACNRQTRGCRQIQHDRFTHSRMCALCRKQCDDDASLPSITNVGVHLFYLTSLCLARAHEYMICAHRTSCSTALLWAATASVSSLRRSAAESTNHIRVCVVAKSHNTGDVSTESDSHA